MSLFDQISALLPLNKKTETGRYFFALNIEPSQVSGVVWGLFGHKLDVLGKATLEYEGTDELLQKSNQVLDEALGALEIEPQQILFGVPQAWNLDDNLKEPYLKLLSKMVKEFDLEPMAYVTSSHALAHFLQKQEGVPTTAILLGLGDHLEATLVKGGKIIESKSLKRSEGLYEELEKLLSQFTEVEVLPSRIMIYSTKKGSNISKIKEDLMSYPWVQRLPFLHFPKIELIPEPTSEEALVLAGATEVDPEVDFKHSFLPKPEDSEVKSVRPLAARMEETKLPKNSSEDLGFMAGDITSSDNLEEVEEKELDQEGSLEDQEMNAVPSNLRRIHKNSSLPATYPYQTFSTHKPKARSSPLDLISNPLSLIPSFPKGQGITGLLFNPLIILPVLVGILAIGFVLWTKAEVTVYVDPKVLENTAQVIADPTVKQPDFDKKVIPAQIVTTTEKTTVKAPATGQKQIGDPAKGQVIVYNKTNSAYTFSQGTTLVSGSGLKFSLDSSVTVASQSTQLQEGGSVTTYGNASASVTASAIGPDSNLPAATSLTFSGLADTDYDAKVDQALSGGTSQTVTVVTSDDQAKLKSSVLDTLKAQAKQDLQSKVTDNDLKVITDALTISDSKYSFSKAAGDQATEFSLDATVSFKGTAYKDSDLKTIVADLIKTNVPAGFKFSLPDTETSAAVSDIKSDGRLFFTASFKAKLIPQISPDQVKQAIKGKRAEAAIDSLKSMDHVLGADIHLTPNYPPPLNFLPFLDKNIQVTVTPK